MFHDLFIVVLVGFGVPQVKALRLGQPLLSEYTAGERATDQSEAVEASECEGRKPQWVQEGPIRRLKGPVFNLHIPGPYHTAGMFVGCLARDIGHMVPHGCTKWADLTDEKRDDLHWVDLEDKLSREHTLDGLGCGTNKSMILSTIVRHPLNMFLHRWFACKELEKHPSDNYNTVCQQSYPMCEPGVRSCVHDNIILQAVVGAPEGSVFTRKDLELAKSRLRHFDLIFIVEHLSYTLQLATTRLGWSAEPISAALNATGHKAEESDDQERITRGEITLEHWRRIIERNSLDIELYDYMRELSFGMLQADGLPVPPDDERTVTPQWTNKAATERFRRVKLPWEDLA